MHTLSLFPSLLTFGIFASLVLRLVVAYFLISFGWGMYKNPQTKLFSFAWIVVGLMLIVGIYTQAVAIVGIALIKLDWWTKRKSSPVSKENMMLYAFSVVILLSLLVTGPGAIAVDWPL